MRELPLVLQLDVAGNPLCWVDHEKAAYYATKNLIAWSLQAEEFTLHGGVSQKTGQQSTLVLDTIIAIRGKVTDAQVRKMNRVPLTNRTLFRRDKNICGYCGDHFSPTELSRDHIIPTSRGGPDVWTNVITSCQKCNKFKDNRTPEEASMELLFVPYVPNRAEFLILQNRKILFDQMEFLLARIPPESRAHDLRGQLAKS